MALALTSKVHALASKVQALAMAFALTAALTIFGITSKHKINKQN